MDIEKYTQVTRRAQELLIAHNLTDWKFEFSNQKRRVGECNYSDNLIRYSVHFLDKTPWSQIEDTLLHEVAHALVGPYVKAHGREWQRKAIQLGATPRACTNEAVNTAQPNFIIECSECKKRWKRYRLRQSAYVGATSSCCGAEFKFYKVRKT